MPFGWIKQWSRIGFRTRSGLHRLVRTRRGASALTYGLMLGLVSVAALVAIGGTGQGVNALFGRAAVVMAGGAACTAGTFDGFSHGRIRHAAGTEGRRSPSQSPLPAGVQAADDVRTIQCLNGETSAPGPIRQMATACDPGLSIVGGLCADITPPTPSGVPSLITDSGISGSDGLTNADPVIIAGSGPAAALITLQTTGGTVLGSTTADSMTGDWQISLPGLGEGSHALQAVAEDQAGNAAQPSATLTIVIDRTAPSGASIAWNGPVTQDAQSAVSVDLTGEAGADWTFTVLEGGNVQLSRQGRFDGTGIETLNDLDLSGLSDGTLTGRLVLSDDAGNSSAPTEETVIKNTAGLVLSQSNLTLNQDGYPGACGALTVTNPGATDVTGLSIGVTGDYTQSGTCTNSCGASLAAGATCQIGFRAEVATTTAQSELLGSVSVTGDAGPGVGAVTGSAAVAGTQDLHFDSCAEADATGAYEGTSVSVPLQAGSGGTRFTGTCNNTDDGGGWLLFAQMPRDINANAGHGFFGGADFSFTAPSGDLVFSMNLNRAGTVSEFRHVRITANLVHILELTAPGVIDLAAGRTLPIDIAAGSRTTVPFNCTNPVLQWNDGGGWAGNFAGPGYGTTTAYGGNCANLGQWDVYSGPSSAGQADLLYGWHGVRDVYVPGPAWQHHSPLTGSNADTSGQLWYVR